MNTYEPAVFISYAWNEQSEDVVKSLEAEMTKRGIPFIRDKRNMEYRDSIKEFEDRIGRGQCIAIVLSDKYLRSPHCMYEFIQIAANQQIKERIFPIALSDARLFGVLDRIEYIKYWEQKINELNEKIKSIGNLANIQGITEELNKYDEIRDRFAHLTDLLQDMNLLTPEMHAESGFESMLDQIEKCLKSSAQVSRKSIPSETKLDSEESGIELHNLQSRMQKLPAEAMTVPPSEADLVKDILASPNAGIVKLIGTPERYENAEMRGGGAYYDFVKRDQRYGYGSDIALQDGQLRTGFAGANYGFILRLGKLSFQDLLVESVNKFPSTAPDNLREAWKFMWNYLPPRGIKEIRKHQRDSRNKFIGNTPVSESAVAEEGASYLLRSLQIDRHDILVAMNIQRIYPDRNMILVWHILKVFDTPVATGSED